MALIPYHAPDDRNKVATIAASIAADGWQGAPLVAWGNDLITGAHRYAAAKSLGWDDADIPTIDIRDLAATWGEDFDALCAEEGCDGIDSPMLVYVLDRCVTQQVRDEYGIDVH